MQTCHKEVLNYFVQRINWDYDGVVIAVTRYGLNSQGSNRGEDEIFCAHPERPSFPGAKRLEHGVKSPTSI